MWRILPIIILVIVGIVWWARRQERKGEEDVTKEESEPVDSGLSTHEKYPHVLRWKTGDRIGWKYYRECYLVAIHNDGTATIKHFDDLYNARIEDMQNISEYHRNLTKKVSEDDYSKFIEHVQEEYQKLELADENQTV